MPKKGRFIFTIFVLTIYQVPNTEKSPESHNFALKSKNKFSGKPGLKRILKT